MKGDATFELDERIASLPVVFLREMPVDGQGVRVAPQLMHATFSELDFKRDYAVAFFEYRNSSRPQFRESITSPSLAAYLHATYARLENLEVYVAPIVGEVSA